MLSNPLRIFPWKFKLYIYARTRRRVFGTVNRLVAGDRPGFKSWQGQDFTLLQNVQTGCGAQPASCLVGIVFLSRVEAVGA
jgi:hypothetical protein